MTSTNTQKMTLIAMFVAIVSISAYISIPISAAHISLLNFTILLISTIFPLKDAYFILLVWFLLGCIGVPVFAGGQAGFGYLFSMLGGYSLGFLFTPIIIHLLKGKKYNRIRYTIATVIAAVVIDLCGTFCWMLVGSLTFKSAFLMGFVPFIFLDLLKAVIVAQITPAFKRIITSH